MIRDVAMTRVEFFGHSVRLDSIRATDYLCATAITAR